MKTLKKWLAKRLTKGTTLTYFSRGRYGEEKRNAPEIRVDGKAVLVKTRWKKLEIKFK